MAEADSRTKVVMAWLAIGFPCGFFLLGFFQYGFSAEARRRVWDNIIGRSSGPMAFCLILQPAMAAIAAWHDGVGDARQGRAPFVLALLREPQERFERLRELAIATARVVLLSLVMDVIYRYAVFRTFLPDEAAIVALLLAVLPYIVLRRPITRGARRRFARNNPVSESR